MDLLVDSFEIQFTWRFSGCNVRSHGKPLAKDVLVSCKELGQTRDFFCPQKLICVSKVLCRT